MFDIIIPIRSKSIGLKNKNILNFHNKINLTNYTLNKLTNIKKIRKIFVLTDSKMYKKKLIKHKKIDTNYLRSKSLSKPNSKLNDLIFDFFKYYHNHSKVEKFIIFQVTSPLISKFEILKTMNFIEKNNVSSLMHVVPVLESPYEIIEKIKKGWKFLIKKRLINRQNYLRQFFFITGSLFFFTKGFFRKNKKIYNSNTKYYIVDRINFIDIDDKFTFELAKRNRNLKFRN